MPAGEDEIRRLEERIETLEAALAAEGEADRRARLDVLVERVAGAFENTPYPFAVFDGEGRYRRANMAFHVVFGADRPPPPEYCIYEDPIITAAGMGDRMEGLKRGRPARFDAVWYNIRDYASHIQGKDVFVSSFIFPLMAGPGLPHSLLCFYEDITHRVRAKKGLREKTEGLKRRVREIRCLLEVSRALSGAGEVERRLDGTARLLPGAYASGEAAGAEIRIGEAVHRSGEMREGGERRRVDVRAGGDVVGSVAVCTVAEGEAGAGGGSADGGRAFLSIVAGMLGRAVERERSRAEAIRAERSAAAGSFAAGIVHDFGNVLLGIVGQAEVLAGDPGLGEEGRRRVERIRAAGKEARRLVGTLRDLVERG